MGIFGQDSAKVAGTFNKRTGEAKPVPGWRAAMRDVKEKAGTLLTRSKHFGVLLTLSFAPHPVINTPRAPINDNVVIAAPAAPIVPTRFLDPAYVPLPSHVIEIVEQAPEAVQPAAVAEPVVAEPAVKEEAKKRPVLKLNNTTVAAAAAENIKIDAEKSATPKTATPKAALRKAVAKKPAPEKAAPANTAPVAKAAEEKPAPQRKTLTLNSATVAQAAQEPMTVAAAPKMLLSEATAKIAPQGKKFGNTLRLSPRQAAQVSMARPAAITRKSSNADFAAAVRAETERVKAEGLVPAAPVQSSAAANKRRWAEAEAQYRDAFKEVCAPAAGAAPECAPATVAATATTASVRSAATTAMGKRRADQDRWASTTAALREAMKEATTPGMPQNTPAPAAATVRAQPKAPVADNGARRDFNRTTAGMPSVLQKIEARPATAVPAAQIRRVA